MKTPPRWAQELTLNTIIYLHSIAIDCAVPELVWRKRTDGGSSGACWVERAKIRISSGGKRLDDKITLLHEIAHLTRPPGDHHSLEFWDNAWKLFRWAKLPLRYCLKRQKGYKAKAAVSYYRSKRKKE